MSRRNIALLVVGLLLCLFLWVRPDVPPSEIAAEVASDPSLNSQVVWQTCAEKDACTEDPLCRSLGMSQIYYNVGNEEKAFFWLERAHDIALRENQWQRIRRGMRIPALTMGLW